MFSYLVKIVVKSRDNHEIGFPTVTDARRQFWIPQPDYNGCRSLCWKMGSLIFTQYALELCFLSRSTTFVTNDVNLHRERLYKESRQGFAPCRHVPSSKYCRLVLFSATAMVACVLLWLHSQLTLFSLNVLALSVYLFHHGILLVSSHLPCYRTLS